MKKEVLQLPFFAKASLFFMGMVAFVSVLYIGSGIIVPLIFATMIAIVLQPVVGFFVRKKVNRVLAIIITLILAILILAAFGYFLYSQATRFSDSWPKLVDKFTEIFNTSSAWTSDQFNISPEKIKDWISETKADLFNTSGSIIGKTLISVGTSLVVLFIIPVYVFMIMFYEPLLLEFINRLFGQSNHTMVGKITTKIKNVIQLYLTGLIIELVIVAALNSVGLLILGIQYAVLLGVIGALLNLIPYIGGIVAVALPMMIALVTKPSPWYALYVLAIYYFIQLIDNNYIVPKIVASKVKLNALVSIIVILAFGALWGIPGMFVSIPLTAIVKVIFDQIEPLKPWGFLLGDTMPEMAIFKINIKKRKK
ncbi:MAG: AI-2E family transporter [Bacteroidales bacterium]|jgi:predicted PurR-regulated permease PerM|nr:AI-2E family transporter [Bacteroidales bacterium]NCU35580.1 AI-2E family transporter [Candidatus Falkowbacteria bacterium]MDD2630861.1 AI-2E family transporter [Bacteroidales bacterium]MDD3131376.1 AI-2E family transporter [Bacteroidales bacterium]MDD3526006.1 AI-2E family transporter [Bacteroidales bacterium]